MKKIKPLCKTPTCDNRTGGGLDYCYRCVGAMLDNAAPWQPPQINDSTLPSRKAYGPQTPVRAAKAGSR